jgi:glucose-6-phosphate 1-dehydrogenase
VLEKPFGTDAATAHSLNELLVQLVPEDQIHRVDHFLGKSTVLNMEAPPTLDARELRDRKAQLLRATHLWGDDPASSSRRARYTAGKIGDRELPAYAAGSAGPDDSLLPPPPAADVRGA